MGLICMGWSKQRLLVRVNQAMLRSWSTPNEENDYPSFLTEVCRPRISLLETLESDSWYRRLDLAIAFRVLSDWIFSVPKSQCCDKICRKTSRSFQRHNLGLARKLPPWLHNLCRQVRSSHWQISKKHQLWSSSRTSITSKTLPSQRSHAASPQGYQPHLQYWPHSHRLPCGPCAPASQEHRQPAQKAFISFYLLLVITLFERQLYRPWFDNLSLS